MLTLHLLALVLGVQYAQTGILPENSNKNKFQYKERTIGFTSMNSPPGMDPEATYKFVDIIEVPTDEIEDQEEKNSSENDDDLMASVNDANWPDPIPVNGPNSNLNMGGLLESVNSMVPKKWLDPEKNSAYSREFGTYIGRFQPRAHGISGMVYAVDEQNLFIRNFWYDGTGPDAFFWVGTTPMPTPKGWVVPYPPVNMETTNIGTSEVEVNSLKKMKNKDVLLTLPGTLKIRDIKWLSIWCKRFTVNYGEVYIPKVLEIPEKLPLVPFPPDPNGKLKSGVIKILDSTSFFISKLNLWIEDEPGYRFWVGNSTTMKPDRGGFMVPDQDNRVGDLKTYDNRDVIITLPKGYTMFDINYLAIFNEQTGIILGHIEFDVSPNKIPPALGQTKKPGWWFDQEFDNSYQTSPPPFLTPPTSDNAGAPLDFVPFNQSLKLPNCKELLGRKIRLLWTQETDTEVYFRIQVHMDSSQYAAIGFASNGSPMIEADFVRIFFNQTSNQFTTQDAFQSKRMGCDFLNGGLCSDENHNFKDHVTFMGSAKNLGLAMVDFKRSIMPLDDADSPIPLAGPSQVIVAIGSMTYQREGFSVNAPLNLERENVTIDFTSGNNFCPNTNGNPPTENEKTENGWDTQRIKDKNLFWARLGPTGGYKGYETITGDNAPDVCWWINDKLMPEIYVYRGRTYQFRVQGGDGYQHVEINNPLYITDHKDGGYGLKTDYEKTRETIYAGVDHESPTAIGPICEFKTADGADKAYQSATFEDYFQTLQLACEKRDRTYPEYGILNWTVAENTPDEVYYQSYNAYGMGWKINVLNEGEEPNSVGKLFEHYKFALTYFLVLLLALFHPNF